MVGNPSCLKTEVGGKQEHTPKTSLMKKFVKELAPVLSALKWPGIVKNLWITEIRRKIWKLECLIEIFMEVCKQLREKWICAV